MMTNEIHNLLQPIYNFKSSLFQLPATASNILFCASENKTFELQRLSAGGITITPLVSKGLKSFHQLA